MDRGPQNFKVVLLGEGAEIVALAHLAHALTYNLPCTGRVGKTSTVLRYVQDKFDDKMQATIQASFLKKCLVLNSTSLNMAIWVNCSSFYLRAIRRSHGSWGSTGHSWPGAVPLARSNLLQRR